MTNSCEDLQCWQRLPCPLHAQGEAKASSLGLLADTKKGPVRGGDEIMCQKAHGTCEAPVQAKLLYGCDNPLADTICCFNRDDAEDSGYFLTEGRTWQKEVEGKEVTYFDSVTGKPVFIAPRGRTWAEFLKESTDHGWPSFRDQEVVWENVRCLHDGEAVCTTGTHLGHNIPDKHGNRYCINLVSIAGSPTKLTDDVKKGPVLGSDEIMCQKAHGTCAAPVQANLLYGCDNQLADKICCFNRDDAEDSGYFLTAGRTWQKEVEGKMEVTYFDSVTGKPVFIAPRGRTWAEFLEESTKHGWPSFRDQEVVWENVRYLQDGEAVCTTGTHLGHNVPDKKGNRYCINLVSIAGLPTK